MNDRVPKRKSKEMANKFYNDFDQRIWQGPRWDGYRTRFEVDRDRIIHTSAFRRLQAKTQVFLAGEYDFYRTRLTHSLEVAQIARSICSFLKYSSKFLSEKYYIDSALIEAVGLAHDIGHPPFGHAGERELNILMKPFGGFEGNAQTLRLLTTTIYSAGASRSGIMRRSGMSPTRAFMDGVMKYKTLQNQMPDAPNHFLYNDQSDCLNFVFDNQEVPAELSVGEKLNSFRSIECQIMDWADDIAYRVNDIADSVNAGFIDKSKLERWASSVKLSSMVRVDRDAGLVQKGGGS